MGISGSSATPCARIVGRRRRPKPASPSPSSTACSTSHDRSLSAPPDDQGTRAVLRSPASMHQTISRNSAWRLLTRSGHQQRKHAARATNPVSSRTSTVIPRASPPAVEPVGPAPMRSGHHVPCFGDVSIPSTTMIPAVRARCILALMLRDALDQVGSGPLARPLRRCVRGLTGDVTQEGSDESGRITR